MSCPVCNGTDRCTTVLDLAGGRHLRIAFGGERGMLARGEQCLGCAAHRGTPHRCGCVLEQCPACRERLGTCGHAALVAGTASAVAVADTTRVGPHLGAYPQPPQNQRQGGRLAVSAMPASRFSGAPDA